MQIKCNIITSQISALAKEIGRSDAYTCNLVSAWQTDNHKGSYYPNKSQLIKYANENLAKVRELETAIPVYNYEQDNGQSKLVRHEGNEITLVQFNDINKLFNYFKNDSAIYDIKHSVTNLNEAYRFLLWREQSVIQHGYNDDYRDSDKATRDALAKLSLWKKRPILINSEKPAQTFGQKENKGLPTKNDTINIYAGANENADLSNFAKRSFKVTPELEKELEKAVGFTVIGDDVYTDTVIYNSVEQAFQDAKIAFAFDGTQNSIEDATANRISESIRKASPAEAKRLGRTIPMSKLAVKNWDENSSKVMKILLKESFEQNPQAAQRLLATGEAKLTHTQDKGKWGTEFPKLLMEVREEIRKKHPELIPSTTSTNTSVNHSDETKDRQIVYTPIGKTQQTYTIRHSEDGQYHIINKEGKEVFKEDSKDRRRIFANLAVQEKRAVVVTYRDKKYVVNNKGQIISVTTGNLMNWDSNNGDRKAIIEEANKKFENITLTNEVASTSSITSQLIDHLKASGITVLGKADMAKYLAEKGKPSPTYALQAAKENQKELDDIKAKAIKDGTFMKAPNDKPTNLDEHQWLQTRTKSFKNWFGDWENDPKNASKVVDENGEPLVVYHFTDESTLNNFANDREAYFTSDESGEFIFEPYKNNRKNRIACFLNIKSPVGSDNAYFRDYNTGSILPERINDTTRLNRESQIESIKRLQENYPNADGVVRDYSFGIVDKTFRKREGYTNVEFIAFNPNQIKSATDNNGEFSTENDDIRMAIESSSDYGLKQAQKEYDNAVKESDLPFFKTPDGEVYGFVDKEGNIYLDENVISPKHPIHEYTHLWDRALQKTKPELWNRGVELMKQTSLWKTIEDDANYGAKWKKENLSQEELDNRIASEVHARFVGEGGAKLLEKLAKEKGQEGIIAKLKNWILEAWKSLKATFSDWSEDEINKLTLKDFNHMTVRDFAEGINPNTINQFNQQNQQSMNDNTMPEIGSGAEQLLDVDKSNPMARLAMEINPIQRKARVDMLAHQFSDKLDELVQQKTDELSEELNQEMLRAGGPDSDALYRINKQIQLYNKAFEGRKAIMSTEGTTAKEIFDMIKSDLEESVKDTDSYTPEEIDKYQKVLNNFDLLVNETCARLESTEHVRITFSQNSYHNGNSTSTVVSSNVEDIAQKEEDDEEALGDDDTGKRVEGNAGWSYQARCVDPKTSLSKTTKHILSNIPMLNESGAYMVDDLGYQRYIDEDYAHNVLLNELSSLITPEDFVSKDENGDFIFPALQKSAKKYPWIEQVIDVLSENPQYISAFYADLRKDFIPYWMQYYGQDNQGRWKWFNKQMNAPMALDSTISEIRSDYEHGYRLDEDSVYSVGNQLHADAAKIGIKTVDEAQTTLNDLPSIEDADDEDIDNIISAATKVFRMLGVNTNKNIIFSLLDTDSSVEQLNNAFRAAKNIFDNIAKGNIREGADLITAFNEDYNTIARIVGNVSELANVGSFRNDDKTYYSYSAPNYMDTMFKKFKSDDRRQQYIDNEFKKYDWFYDKETGWNNEWLNLIENDEDVRFNMQMKELKTIKDKTNDPNNRHADYRNWQPMQIKQHFIQEYFSAGYDKGSKKQFAWYNFPIFSDSPIAKFIKFKRYVASNEEGSVEDQLLPLFRKVVKQELGRMKLVAQRREKGAKEISFFDDRGTNFCFFPDFEFYYVKEDGTIYDGFGKTADEIDSSYTPLKEKLSKLADAKDISAINKLIDTAVKYDMDDLYRQFLQDFSKTEIQGLRLNNEELTKLGEDVLEDLMKSGELSDSINFSDKLHEYFWNQAYATTQIIEITTTDLAFYKNDNDFQKRYKEIYAAGTKLNTLSKYGKKYYKTMYLTDNIITSPSYNDIKKSLDDAVAEHHITKADRDSILKQLEGINVADAQAYRSLDSIRSVLDMMGQWTPEMDITYEHIKSGKWNMDDLNTIWQTLKPFVYTQIDSSNGIGGRMKVPHQNKNSEFALLQAYIAVATGSSRDGHIKTKTSNKLKAMADFMEENHIDVLQFQSAVKTGNQGDINLNFSHKNIKDWCLNFLYQKDENGNLKTDKDGKYIVKEDILNKAIKEKDINKDEAQDFINNKMDLNLIEKLFKNWHTRRLDEGSITQKEFNKTMNDMQPSYDETKQILKDKAFTNGKENEEIVHTIPFDDYIIQQPTPEHLLDTKAVFGSQFRNLIISDLPEDFKLKVHGKELSKQEILDLYNSLIVENLLDDFDELKKRFKNIETFQEALIQEVNGNPKYGRDMLDALQLIEVKDENGKTHKEFNIPLYNPSTTLKIQELVNSMFKNKITKQDIKGGACILVSSFGFTNELHVLHNPDGSIKGMECYMPAYSKDFFEPFMKEDENGNPYLDPSDLPDELRKAIGYRIPTEDKYSMAPLYIKGFLPQENGSEIMLPAETTLFSGEDYDVDKKFLILPEYKVQEYDMQKAYRDYLKAKNEINEIGNLFKNTSFDTIVDTDQSFKEWFNGLKKEEKEAYKLDKPIITKIKYDIDKKPQEQSRAARNNMIFDLAYSILTNKDTAEKIHNPGSFDKAKREARMAKIAGNKQLLSIWSNVHHTSNNVEATVDSLLKASLSDMTDFLKSYDKEKTQMTVDTFIYNHKQNMTGAALIGMYANNTSMQAKFQQTNIGIKDDYTFIINGRRIKSLHDITSPLNERISKNCANFSAASVDNVKDPVLADLRQNTNTANIMGMLIRAGLSIQEASLMFQQPIIAQWIDETEGQKIDNLKKLIKAYNQKLVDDGGEIINIEDVIKTDFTSKELLANVVKGLNDNDIANLAENIKTAFLFYNVANIANDVSELTRISRADSPNGAIKPSIAGAFGQLMRVADYHEKAKTKEFTLTGISDCVKNNQLLNLYDDRNAMRDKLLKSKMPLLQAFYSLGIESARHFLSPYFAQMTNYMSRVTRIVGNNAVYDNIPEQVLNTLYKDAMYYALTHSKLFGNGIEVNGKSTYEDKRRFYLYQYPKQLMNIIAANPDIAQLTAIKKLEVRDGVIRMTNSGRLSQAARESLQRDFDTLLYMDNPAAHQLAIDLFMYSFYKEGYNFGPNTIGGMFSTLFLDSIPEYVQALRGIPNEMPNSEEESTFFDDFLNQFYANRYNMAGILPMRTVNSENAVQSGDTITVPFNVVKNWKTSAAFEYVGLKDKDGSFLGYYTRLHSSGDNVVYTKLTTINDVTIDGKTFNDTKYDANSTAADIAESLRDEIELRDEAGMLKTDDDIFGGIDSLLGGIESAAENTDDTAKAAMNDETQNQAPADIKQQANVDLSKEEYNDLQDEFQSFTSEDWAYTTEGGQNTLKDKMCP